MANFTNKSKAADSTETNVSKSAGATVTNVSQSSNATITGTSKRSTEKLYLLKEDGDNILMEQGGSLLLESGGDDWGNTQKSVNSSPTNVTKS